jgi:hypothetical protein
MKKDLKWIALICLAGLAGFIGLSTLIAGCGEKTESTFYYYSPSTTRDGKIIYVKKLESVRKDAIGTQLGSTVTESIMTMTAAGASETFLVDVSNAPPSAMTCAPVGDYVGYLDGLSGVVYSKIILLNIAAGSHKGLNKIELTFDPGIKSFDWSNDAKKLVYCTSTEVHTINLDGTGDAAIVTGATDISFVTWKFGTKVAYVNSVASVPTLSLMNGDGTGIVTNLTGAFVNYPQISSVNPNLIYGINGGSYCKVDITAPATVEVKTPFAGNLPRLAQAADIVVYDKTSVASGIFALTLATSAEAQIKP